jgi:hypothetical protein
MARKTKAELEAEREEAKALAEAHEFAQYPTRLMAALELALKNNFDLDVSNSKFVVRDRDSRNSETFTLTLFHNSQSQWVLENLEYTLQEKEELYAERERQYARKLVALAKLTPEEKELLDL